MKTKMDLTVTSQFQLSLLQVVCHPSLVFTYKRLSLNKQVYYRVVYACIDTALMTKL